MRSRLLATIVFLASLFAVPALAQSCGQITNCPVAAAPLNGTEVVLGVQNARTVQLPVNQAIVTSVTAPPSPPCNWSTITTAFQSCDISNINLGFARTISGATTLGQPTSTYVYTPEVYPVVVYLQNNSGWNQSTSTDIGRTAAVAFRTYVSNLGQGDAVAYNCTGFVDGAKPGATNWLANPAVSCFNGDETAGAAGVYLNPYETNITDNGFDASGIGAVYNLNRSVGTAALDEFWTGVRVQSGGTAEIDSVLSATGPMKVFLDETPATLDPTSHAFIASVRGSRWYGNAIQPSDPNGQYFASLGTDYIDDDSSVGGWLFVVGNAAALEVNAAQVTIPVPLATDNGIIQGGTPPTLSGTCTTGTQVGGNTAGRFAATCTSQTVIMTFDLLAPHGWACFAQDQTTGADTLKQTANSTAGCTLTGTTVAADTIVFTATAF